MLEITKRTPPTAGLITGLMRKYPNHLQGHRGSYR